MNLLAGEVVPTADGPRFRGAVAWGTDEPGMTWPGFGAVTLGIRPEHIALTSPGTPGSIAGSVLLVEDVGADVYVSVTLAGGATVWVRTNARHAIDEEQPVALVFDAQHVRWFDEAGIHLRQEPS